MYIAFIYAFLLLLFLLCFLFARGMLIVWLGRSKARSRLMHLRQAYFSKHLAAYIRNSRYHWLYRHLADFMEAVHWKIKIGSFLMGSLLLFLFGIFFGFIFFHSFKGMLIASLVLSLSPYLALRMKVIGLQMKTRIEFLPAVEIYYQYYVLSGSKNMRSVLKQTIEGERIVYPMKAVFEQLHRNLSMHREMDDCFRIFTLTLGHKWADYFANIIQFGLVEGIDVTDNLKGLIGDMRKAQRADQAERNRLLEIRLANFSSVFFLLVFLMINFKINFHQSYFYYVIDPAGRNMLLDAALLIFASFLMGVYLSIRRM